MYRPLPREVTIKKSFVNGLGLFATEDIKERHEFGISHVKDIRFENGYIRTPLGAFINHSETPNCEFYEDKEFRYLKTVNDISEGTELVAKYRLYGVK